MQANTNRKRQQRARGVAPGRLFIMAAVVALVSLLPAAQVAAADITVDGDCSLANAIREANGAAQSGSLNNCEDGTNGSGAAGADTITLTGNVTLSELLPEITSDVTIDGGGYTIGGQSRYRIFFQSSGEVRLENLNLSSARTNYSGGAILLVGGSLTLDKVSVTDSVASGQGGGIHSSGGTFAIRNSFFTGNIAGTGSGGGAIAYATNSSGASSIENSTFFGNRAGWGGAIYASGSPDDETLTLSHVTITGNRKTAESEQDFGGGIESATPALRIYNSIVYGNGEIDCQGTSLRANAGNIIGANGCSGSSSTVDPLLPAGLTRPADGSPPYFALPENSPAVNNAVDDHCLATDQRGVSRPYPADGKCDIGAYEYSGAPSARQPRQDSPPPRDENPPPENNPPLLNQNPPPVDRDPPPENEGPNPGGRPGDSAADGGRVAPTSVPTCLSLPSEIVVSNFVSGTQCQTVRTDAGIGNAAIVSAGYLDAVDIWGTVPAHVSVCFRAASGRFLFLDASMPSPRVASSLEARSANGWTCTSISSAGTVVLMPPPADEPFSNCSVTTTGSLNLRAEPYGDVLGLVPQGTTLAAAARSSGYLQVSYGGVTGWISEAYVTTSGDCG